MHDNFYLTKFLTCVPQVSFRMFTGFVAIVQIVYNNFSYLKCAQTLVSRMFHELYRMYVRGN